jgi:UDP:flavonoid glycosyltransferase YjiC (YdhE family)
MEAAYNGVPVLAVPLFAGSAYQRVRKINAHLLDQNYNAALLIRRGMSIFQDIRDVDEEQLVAKLSKLLNDPR